MSAGAPARLWCWPLAAATLAAAACADEPGPCADAREVFALPTPAWEADGGLTPPPGDRAAALMDEHRPRWLRDLVAVDGWPARPSVVLPLSGAASAVDATSFNFWVRGVDGYVRVDDRVDVTLASDARSVVVRATRALPAGVERAILAVAGDALTGARPLPVCAPDDAPEPAYARALAALPRGSAARFALPFPVSRVEEELRGVDAVERASPSLAVESLVARELASYGSLGPTAETAALLAPQVAEGLLALPDYRDADGVFVVADGLPLPQGITRPGVLVALPASGAAPFPTVLFQHGGDQAKTELFRIAGPLAAAGFALVAIDLPFHGDRAGPSGGSFAMVDFERARATRDNLRQAAADHLAVRAGLATLDAAVGAALGVEDPFDEQRVFFMGLSMGAVSGAMSFTVDPAFGGAALFVGGADYPAILAAGFFSLFVLDLAALPVEEHALLMALLETLLNGADPAAYARRAELVALPPRPVLLFQAAGDIVIPEPANDALALAFGAGLAQPATHAVPGLVELALPAANNFTWPHGGAAATRLLIQAPMAEVSAGSRHPALIRQDYAQQLVAHCLRTLVDAGSCEVIDTGFAAR